MYIHVELYNLVREEASGTSARVGDRDRGWVGGSWGKLQGEGEDGLPIWLKEKMRPWQWKITHRKGGHQMKHILEDA